MHLCGSICIYDVSPQVFSWICHPSVYAERNRPMMVNVSLCQFFFRGHLDLIKVKKNHSAIASYSAKNSPMGQIIRPSKPTTYPVLKNRMFPVQSDMSLCPLSKKRSQTMLALWSYWPFLFFSDFSAAGKDVSRNRQVNKTW